MKIIDATKWEKRNLGTEVTEIQCAETDSVEELETVLKADQAPYSVVKIPAGCSELLLAAQRCGYSVVEMIIALEGNLDKIRIPEKYAHFLPDLHMEKATVPLLEEALSEVAAGDIFATDRIALDPHYSRAIAGKRYYNWILDALKDDASMDIAYYKDRPISFHVGHWVDEEKGVYGGVLGGLFTAAAGIGKGFMLIYNITEQGRQAGGKICTTRVSSNNPRVLRLYLRFGYEVTGMNYVLIRHR